MKINLGHQSAEFIRYRFTKLQWCAVIWYSCDDNSVWVTFCPSLKACLQEVFNEIDDDRKQSPEPVETFRDIKSRLVQHVVDCEDIKPFVHSYDCNCSVTIQIVEDKHSWKETAKELDYEC